MKKEGNNDQIKTMNSPRKLNYELLNTLLSYVNPYDLNQTVTSEINLVVGAVF